jgi:soluble lytic murein transglycosylase
VILFRIVKKTSGRLFIIALIFFAAASAMGIQYHTSRYDEMIGKAAARNGVDFYLVKSLIYEESWFRSGIRGPAGEVGLMQITPAAASDFAGNKGFPPLEAERLLEPELNLEIGCWYLQQSLAHYRNTPNPELFALLGYNAGESRADSWLKRAQAAQPASGVSPENHCLAQVDFPKTRAYVRRILKRARSHNFWF